MEANFNECNRVTINVLSRTDLITTSSVCRAIVHLYPEGDSITVVAGSVQGQFPREYNWSILLLLNSSMV